MAASLESFALDMIIIISVGLLTFTITYIICYCCPIELGEDQVQLTKPDGDYNLRNKEDKSRTNLAHHVKITVVPNDEPCAASTTNSKTSSRKLQYSIRKNGVVVPLTVQHQQNNEREQQVFNVPTFNANQKCNKPQSEVHDHETSSSITANDNISRPPLNPVLSRQIELSDPPYNPFFSRGKHFSGNGNPTLPPSAPPLSILSL